MIILFLLLSWISRTIAVCPYTYTYHLQTEKCYKEYKDQLTFFAASDICRQAGASLLSVHNASENDYVYGLTKGDQRNHWIGLTKMIDGKKYTWLDETPFNYSNWNLPQAEGDCGFMKNNTGKWESGSCRYFLPFVCQYDPAVARRNSCPTGPFCTSCVGGSGQSGNTTGPSTGSTVQPPSETPTTGEPLGTTGTLEVTTGPPSVTTGQTTITTGQSTSRASPVTTVYPSVTTGPSECPEGWKFFPETGFCYLVGGDNIGINHTQARKLCGDRGAELASIHSSAENAFIVNISYYVQRRTATAWIGVYRTGPNAADFANIDDTPLDYTNWSPVRSQPDNHGGYEYCVMMYINSPNMADGEWNDRKCIDYPYAYICKKPAAAIPSPATAVTLETPETTGQSTVTSQDSTTAIQDTTTPTTKCGDGWKFFDRTGFCYFFGTGVNNTNKEAQTLCKNQNSHLASIHSLEENTFIFKSINELKLDSKYRDAWLGIRRNVSNPHFFVNDDGTPVDYTNWAQNPGGLSWGENCTVMHIFGTAVNGKWNDVICDTTKPSAYVCKKAITTSQSPTTAVSTQPPTTVAPDTTVSSTSLKCDDGWKFSNYTGFCYLAGNGVNYTNMDARAFCKKQNSYLASIHSQAENDFLVNYLQEQKLNEVFWIGLYRIGPNATDFTYEDATKVDYANWAPQQPDDYHVGENCVHMYSSRSGVWNDVWCDGVEGFTFSYICKKAPTTFPPSITTTTLEPIPSSPNCDHGWKLSNSTGFCYRAMPGTKNTHMEAQSLCKNQNSKLASIHSPAENAFILELIIQQRFFVYKAWIGLYRQDKVFVNEDGTPVDFTNWALHEPNGLNIGERCSMMYLSGTNYRARAGTWNDLKCENIMPSVSVCKKAPA